MLELSGIADCRLEILKSGSIRLDNLEIVMSEVLIVDFQNFGDFVNLTSEFLVNFGSQIDFCFDRLSCM
jgi:hypothetical protein